MMAKRRIYHKLFLPEYFSFSCCNVLNAKANRAFSSGSTLLFFYGIVKEVLRFSGELFFVKFCITRCRIVCQKIHQKKTSRALALVSAEAVKGILVV